MSMPRRRSRRRLRRGMSALEVVMVTALMLPTVVGLTFIGIRVLRTLFTVVGSMVGSPLL